MSRPKLPRAKGCRFCGKSLLDPALDAPSRLGKLARYHHRCWQRVKAKRLKEERIARLAWRGIPPGCRVTLADYKKTNGHATPGGHQRKRFPPDARGAKYRSWQVCACGRRYIGGANAVRCMLCQAAHTRELKHQWALKNRDKTREYMRRWRERRAARERAAS